MVLTQTVPSVIYRLDLDVFRLALKALEDTSDGMAFERTHKHNTSVTVGGAVLARVIEIINGYSVRFEDDGTPAGQYRVETVGANSNIGSVIQVNQVSVSTSNSAGLQDLNSLQAASFGGVVTVDVTSSFSGEVFPVGTNGNPVNNITDAHVIAEARGIRKFLIVSDMTLSSGDFSDGHEFQGVSAATATITIDAAAEVSKCTFRNLTIQGTLDNANVLRECSILNITNINGFIFQCAIGGTIILGGGSQSTIMSCYSGVAGGDVSQTPTIDMGGSGQNLVLRGYSGGIKIINKTGTDPCSIDMQSGQVVVDSTVTAGEITVRGIAKVTNLSTGTATILDETESFINKATLSQATTTTAILAGSSV